MILQGQPESKQKQGDVSTPSSVPSSTATTTNTPSTLPSAQPTDTNLSFDQPGDVPYTSYSVPIKKEYVPEVEVITVTSNNNKVEVDPEAVSLQRVTPFVPLIKNSVNIKLKDNQPLEQLDPASIVDICKIYQQTLLESAKSISVKQNDVFLKMRDFEATHSKKTLYALALKITDMKHHSAQFKEVDRFCVNLQRTHDSIKEIVTIIDKLNDLLPDESRLESLSTATTTPPTATTTTTNTDNITIPTATDTTTTTDENVQKTEEEAGDAEPKTENV